MGKKSYKRQRLNEVLIDSGVNLTNTISMESNEMIKETIKQGNAIGYVLLDSVEKELKNKAIRRRNFNRTNWRYNSYKKSYSKKYKGEYITIFECRYNNWAVFFADQKIWDYNGKKISSFEVAEKVAFEIFEKYHTTRDERQFRYYIR